MRGDILKILLFQNRIVVSELGNMATFRRKIPLSFQGFQKFDLASSMLVDCGFSGCVRRPLPKAP
jgi:hypothetical protein